MIGRRITAYFIDLAIFGVSTILSILVGKLIADSFTEMIFVQYIIAVPFFLLFTLITSGIMGVLLRGSLGKKLMDLRVESTNGYVTAFRLMFRDYTKYILYVPFIAGLMRWVVSAIDERSFFVTTIYITGSLLVVLGVAHIYHGLKYQKMMLDQVFFTRVENDIPTAIEYENLSEFIKEQEKKK